MVSRKKKICINVVSVAILVMGTLFLHYHTHDYFVRLREERIAQENANMMRDIFGEQTENIADTISGLPPAQDEEDHEADTEGDTEADNAYYIGIEAPTADLTPYLGTLAAFNAARALTGNQDIVAYIYIPETNVNYAVVQGEDNVFYLTHDIFGNWNAAGSIFLDYLNAPDFTDPNTIIYGHNMNRGMKFHNLRYYVFGDRRQDFLAAHPNILIITEQEVLVYEIFSVFTTGIDFYYIQVNFAYGEFEAFVRELNRRSLYDTGITATAEDTLLLLSTCTNLHADTRIVVAGRLAQRLRIPEAFADGN